RPAHDRDAAQEHIARGGGEGRWGGIGPVGQVKGLRYCGLARKLQRLRRQRKVPAAMPRRGHGNPTRGISVSSWRGWGPAASEEGSACGHAEARTWESEARHLRQFAAGVGPPPPVKKSRVRL